MVNEYAQPGTRVNLSAHIDLHRCSLPSAVGIQDTCAGGKKDERSQICRSTRRSRFGWLGVGEHDTVRSDVQVYGVCFQARSPLAPHQQASTSDARSLGPRLNERASSLSDQARRAPSLARRPLPAHTRFRVTPPFLFLRRPAPPCVAAFPASPASPIYTGPPPGREKDRAAARLAVPSVREEGVR